MNTDTSTLAEQSVKPSTNQQMVLDILIAAHMNRTAPMAAGEIRRLLERKHAPDRFDKGWVTGRLDELRDKGVVDRSEERWRNPETKKLNYLWFIPAQQARLCA